tara:strand:+ start:101 stop:1618 length:1518 start_codon:yes stop_codon:yes gene_type:complete
MPGGELQLSYYGEEDIILNGNPQITFFVSVFKRYTNFAIENIRQYFVGEADFGKKVQCIIDKCGDLMSDVFLQIKLPSLVEFNNKIKDTNLEYRWINYIGNAIIDYVEIEIGTTIIDKHYGIWLQIWAELTITDEKKEGYYEMIGYSGDNPYFNIQTEYNLYIPLIFWFCKCKGLALPLLALQESSVRINVVFRKATDLIIRKNCSLTNIETINCGNTLITKGGLKIQEAHLYVDYIFLDDNERRWFINNEHEYLIEQLQLDSQTLHTRGTKNTKCNVDKNGTIIDEDGKECSKSIQNHRVHIDFKHPVKELIWVFVGENMVEINETTGYQGNEWFNFGINTYENCKNNKNEPVEGDIGYNEEFNLNSLITNEFDEDCNPNDHTIDGLTINAKYGINPSNISPMIDATLYFEGNERFETKEYQYFKLIQPYQNHTNIPLDWIYTYSFAFEPEKVKPTGTCNFSHIDNTHFVFNLSKYVVNPQLNMFATNYNILKIKGGIGSVRYK